MIWQCLGCSAKAAKGRFSSAFTFKTTFTFEKSQDLFFFLVGSYISKTTTVSR